MNFLQTPIWFIVDRDFAHTHCSRGGGVLVAVDGLFSSSLVSIDNNNELSKLKIDVKIVKVKSQLSSLIIVNVYTYPITSR